MDSDIQSVKKEKKILKISFFSGLFFALAELIFAIYSHSQSVLTDAVYDASELVFIALLLFLTPLFHKPVTEKHPYGYFQIESIFLIIKGFMMLSVSLGVFANITETLLSGGNSVKSKEISVFQMILGVVSIFIYCFMKKNNSNLSSPTINAELLGWKIDILYSFGMSFAFFVSNFLNKTPLSFISPYFDQIIAIIIMILTLPESIKILCNSIKDVFLFSPEEETVDEIKSICRKELSNFDFEPVFFDITKTGRHLWIAVYFKIKQSALNVKDLENATERLNAELFKKTGECTCELILTPKNAKTKKINQNN